MKEWQSQAHARWECKFHIGAIRGHRAVSGKRLTSRFWSAGGVFRVLSGPSEWGSGASI